MARRKATETEGVNGAAAGPGHNGADSDVFFKHIRNIEAAERAQKTAVAHLRTARKEAKADGIDLKQLDAARTLNKYSEPELAAMFNNLVRYAQYLELPVYSQISLFTTDAEKALTEDDALKKGIVAGKRGEPDDRNPWDLTTPMGQAWGRGHKQGNLELAGQIKQKPDGQKDAFSGGQTQNA